MNSTYVLPLGRQIPPSFTETHEALLRAVIVQFDVATIRETSISPFFRNC